MAPPVLLRGYHYSVYNRIVRVVLHEKGVAYAREEVDPFASDLPQGYLERHPFGRVPVLTHGSFDVYETVAIARYVDAAFEGPPLVPTEPEAIARMAQVISITDAYGYRPMVRQVFAHRVFRRAAGEISDEAEIAAGLKASPTVLDALERIAAEGHVLDGQRITLADCHLAPMVAYFRQAPEGAEAFDGCPALDRWWVAFAGRNSLVETEPGLPTAVRT